MVAQRSLSQRLESIAKTREMTVDLGPSRANAPTAPKTMSRIGRVSFAGSSIFSRQQSVFTVTAAGETFRCRLAICAILKRYRQRSYLRMDKLGYLIKSLIDLSPVICYARRGVAM